MTDGLVRIGELAARCGVTVRTLRVYEERGLIKPVERSANGYRWYDPSLEVPLRAMGAALALGLSLAEIGELFAHVTPLTAEPDGDDARQCLAQACVLYRRRLAQIDAAMAALAAQRSGVRRRIARCTRALRQPGTYRIEVPTGVYRHRRAGRVEYVRG